MKGMFTETLTDFIHGFIEGSNLINSYCIIKKGILDRKIRAHLHKNYPCCPIQYTFPVETTKCILYQFG